MPKTPTASQRIHTALCSLPLKLDASSRSEKKGYSEAMSHALAGAISQCFTDIGFPDMQPRQDSTGAVIGQERRIIGGIGAKKVDITCASPEAGLILAGSIKTINWRDAKSKSFQKNLTNRRGDLLFESVTLHKRFPYAVLVGFFFLDSQASSDGTALRSSTFQNAHHRLQLFTGRENPGDSDERFERLYVGLVNASPAESSIQLYEAGQPDSPIAFEQAIADIAAEVAVRNSDLYAWREGKLTKP